MQNTFRGFTLLNILNNTKQNPNRASAFFTMFVVVTALAWIGIADYITHAETQPFSCIEWPALCPTPTQYISTDNDAPFSELIYTHLVQDKGLYGLRSEPYQPFANYDYLHSGGALSAAYRRDRHNGYRPLTCNRGVCFLEGPSVVRLSPGTYVVEFWNIKRSTRSMTLRGLHFTGQQTHEVRRVDHLLIAHALDAGVPIADARANAESLLWQVRITYDVYCTPLGCTKTYR